MREYLDSAESFQQPLGYKESYLNIWSKSYYFFPDSRKGKCFKPNQVLHFKLFMYNRLIMSSWINLKRFKDVFTSSSLRQRIWSAYYPNSSYCQALQRALIYMVWVTSGIKKKKTTHCFSLCWPLQDCRENNCLN